MEARDVKHALQRARDSALDNFHDLRADHTFTDEEVRVEARIIDELSVIIDGWDDVAPYMEGDST